MAAVIMMANRCLMAYAVGDISILADVYERRVCINYVISDKSILTIEAPIQMRMLGGNVDCVSHSGLLSRCRISLMGHDIHRPPLPSKCVCGRDDNVRCEMASCGT